MLSFNLAVLDDSCHSHSLAASYGVHFCVVVFFFTFGVNICSVSLHLIKGMSVIARDREMKESARRGPQDEEALCCSFALCLLLLA